ncbi:MAG: KEOPS complex kinase/ATPase Bud32 [Candidatus Pacearchaeota archaeon]|nr:KEOPS complex kinase/ATPase Bud32 [Candidatus Pacearchaeota archaeon]
MTQSKKLKEKIIGRGAEAILIQKGKILIKRRVKKSYRHEQIDSFLRTSRTKHESKILQKAFGLISVPQVHKTTEFEISMDFIKGKKLSDYLDNFSKKESLKICKKIGQEVAKIHQADIVHGDLTTSNMIYKNKKVFLIDFGLGFHSTRAEDKAVDIHLLREALESKHFKRWQIYFQKVLDGYKWPSSCAVLKQLEKVEQRGRYKNREKY